jgi:serine/threonine-protein kinase RIO1
MRTRLPCGKLGPGQPLNNVLCSCLLCVSGKEANVYHASAPDGTDLAIKVYKTSILVFKDRDRWGHVWPEGILAGGSEQRVD